MKTDNFLRLTKTPTPEVPPAGSVDLFYDADSGTFAKREADGTVEEIGSGGTAIIDNAAVNAAIAQNPAAARLALEMNGVVVSKADGTRKGYAPAADTDTARGLALEAAFAAAVAGDTIDLAPGNYLITKTPSNAVAGIQAQFIVLDRMTIRLNGARLYKDAAAATKSAMFSIASTDTTSDWSIMGPGTIDGMNAYTPGASATGADCGIFVAGNAGNGSTARRWRICDLTIKNHLGYGAVFASYYGSGYGGNKHSTGHVDNCNFEYNYVNVQMVTEYLAFTNCSFNNGSTGVEVYNGNHKFVACEANANNSYAFRIYNGGNDGHGTWTGGSMNHNTGFSVWAEANMNNGYTFSGAHFYADSATTNKIQSLGGGVVFCGCIIDSPFFASATPTGINTAVGCHMPISVVSAAQAVSDLSAAERLQWVFTENYTLAGGYANNDDRIYVFANDAAAATGGLVAGRRYSTSTGELRIKL